MIYIYNCLHIKSMFAIKNAIIDKSERKREREEMGTDREKEVNVRNVECIFWYQKGVILIKCDYLGIASLPLARNMVNH